jgi:hypothetical protein
MPIHKAAWTAGHRPRFAHDLASGGPRLRRNKAPRHGGNASNVQCSNRKTDQPQEAKTHQPQSSHAVTNCGRRYDLRAGESGGAHARSSHWITPRDKPTSGDKFSASSWLHDGVCLSPHSEMMSLSGSLIGAQIGLSRAREESWDEQTLHGCQSGTPYEPAALHDPPRTDNPKDQGFLDCLGVAWVAPCFGSLLQSSHPMGFHAASNTMTPQHADKRMAVLSHLAVWWCSSRRAPLGRFGCANERCRSKTNARRTRLERQEQTIKPPRRAQQPLCLWLASHIAQP